MSNQTPSQTKPTLTLPKWLVESFRGPDRSRDGFDRAVAAALAIVAEYDWVSIEALCEEIANDIGAELRAGEIEVEFAAGHRRSGRSRIVVRTRWGFRAAIDVPVTFSPRKAGKAN